MVRKPGRVRRPARQIKQMPIDELLNYWKKLSKTRTIAPKDVSEFIRMIENTLLHFGEHYRWRRSRDIKDKFLEGASFLVFQKEAILKKVRQRAKLDNQSYNLIKDVAAKFSAKIKKDFAQDIEISKLEKTPAQDSEQLISTSGKLSYKWGAGIIISNHIALQLARLLKVKKGEKFKDDILALYMKLKGRTTDSRLKRFLEKSYRRFEDADKTRNRCAHVNEGEPTLQEIRQSIELSRLLQRFVR